MEDISFQEFQNLEKQQEGNFTELLHRETRTERKAPDAALRHAVVIPERGEIIRGNLQGAVESIFVEGVDLSTIEAWFVINADKNQPHQEADRHEARGYVRETRELVGLPTFAIDCGVRSLNIGMIKDLGTQIALKRLKEVQKPNQSIIFLDADSRLEKGFFEAIQLHLESGANVILPTQIFIPNRNLRGEKLNGFFRFIIDNLRKRIITFFETKDLAIEYPGITVRAEHLNTAGDIPHVTFGELEFLYQDNIDQRTDIVFSPEAEVIIEEDLGRGWHSGEFRRHMARIGQGDTSMRDSTLDIRSLDDLQSFPNTSLSSGLLQFLQSKIQDTFQRVSY